MKKTLFFVLFLVLSIASIGFCFDVSGGKYLSIRDDNGDIVDIDSEGQMHVILDGKVDTNNQTTTPLLANGVFTGTGTDIFGYSGIATLIGSDQDGTLLVQYSPDNITWYPGEAYDIVAGANKFFTPPAQSGYYRFVYTNGPVDQTSLYIHPVIKKNPIKWSSHNIDESIVDQDDAVLVKAVLTGLAPDGTYKNVLVTNAGEQKISVEAFDDTVSSNSNTQLNVTPYNPSGVAFRADSTTGAYCTSSYAHCEIHEGNHFFVKDWVDLGNAAVYDILIKVADTTKWPHFLFEVRAEAEFNIILYKDPTVTDPGTPISVINRNNNSATTAGMLVYHTPTVSAVGTQVARYKGGSAQKVGGEARASGEVVLDQNAYYMARITNDTALNNWIDYFLDWYEHTNL